MTGKRKRADPNAETNISKKVFYVRKVMTRALKKCRTFEIQKVTKRLKKARTEDNIEVADTMLEELGCCKTLDLESIADAHIKSVIVYKDLALRTNEILMARIEEFPTLADLRPVESRISSRLFNTTVCKSTSTVAKQILMAAIATDDIEPDARVQRKQITAEKPQLKQKTTKEASEPKASIPASIPQKSKASLQPFHPPSSKHSTTIQADIVAAPPTISSFLPTLAAQYISGSESDSEEEEQTRKNRRGQRARREIWEKKFGRGANHVRGSMHPDRANLAEQSDPRPISTGSAKFAAPKNAPIVKPDKPVHPSWQAQQERRNREKNAEFQGKKTVF